MKEQINQQQTSQPPPNLQAIREFNQLCQQERTKPCQQEMRPNEKRVHNYIIDTQKSLGEGSFSQVYKGVAVGSGREVAVKVMEIKTVKKMKI